MKNKLLECVCDKVKSEGILTPEQADYSFAVLNGLKNLQSVKIGECYCFYIVFDEINGRKTLAELFIYTPKESRNSLDFLRMIKFLEREAKEKKCSVIKFGGNYRQEDNRLCKYLIKKGYCIDTVYKEIK